MRCLIPFALFLTSCVAYRPAPVDYATTAAAIDAYPGGRLDFDAAYARALATHHEILRLNALARAAGDDLTPASVTVSANTRDEMSGAMADPLALAKAGQRGAEARVRACERDEILAELRVEELTLAADLAEAFLVERTLAGWRVPAIDLDAASFRDAGLASDAAAAMLEAARASADAERREIAALRESNLARIRHLLPLGPDARLEIVPPPEDFPAIDETPIEERPDLQYALARYRTADAVFRQKVVDQYPSLEIGSEIGFDGRGLGGVAAVRLPVGASAPARAAEQRREAARAEVEGALLTAREEIVEARQAYETALARARASALSRHGMEAAYAAALARIEVEPDAFDPAADIAGRAVAEATMARASALELVRARVALARAMSRPRRVTR